MHRLCPIPSDQARSFDIYSCLLPIPISTHGQATNSPPHPCGFHSPYCLCRNRYDFSKFDVRCNYDRLRHSREEQLPAWPPPQGRAVVRPQPRWQIGGDPLTRVQVPC